MYVPSTFRLNVKVTLIYPKVYKERFSTNIFMPDHSFFKICNISAPVTFTVVDRCDPGNSQPAWRTA